MKKHLLALGDIRIGDCLHVGSFLNRFKDVYETTWLHGTYETQAVRFLKDHTDLNIPVTIVRPSLAYPFPMDAMSIENFKQQYLPELDDRHYDIRTDNADPIIPNRDNEILFKTRNLPEVDGLPDRYIVTHMQSISYWKNYEFLFHMDFELPIVAVGLPGDRINKFALDYRGRELAEIASILLKAEAAVGVHSAIACLAFHLGVPLVTCLFGDGRTAVKFSEFRKRCIDILWPDKRQVLEALKCV